MMLYIHIPMCSAKCHYCSFYSVGQHTVHREALIRGLCEEIEVRAAELSEEIGAKPELETIYFGGGTPSILSTTELKKLLSTIHSTFNVTAIKEVTLEANPDHLTPEFLGELRTLGVSRLSIGVQSFCDERLKNLGRRHSAEDARLAVKNARAAGFDNISIDLMFGFGDMTLNEWSKSVQSAVELGIEHISAYQLTIEEGSNYARRGERCASDKECQAQYLHLCAALQSAGYEHYEISNFALPHHHSRHNSGYWLGERYIGVGPSAHSFDGNRQRSWNVSSIEKYLNKVPRANEILDDNDVHNEYVMLHLRTSSGISLREYSLRFAGRELPLIEGLSVDESGQRVYLNEEHLFIADSIICKLFI